MQQAMARISSEHQAAYAALKSALQHAANAGKTLSAVRRQMSEGPWQRWVDGGGCPVSQHIAMVCMRIGHANIDSKLSTLSDLMMERAAHYIAASKETK